MRTVLSSLLLLAAAFTFQGCTEKKPMLKIGSPAFPFDPAAVSEFTIAATNPDFSSSWTARLTRKGPSWQIVSAQNGQPLKDRLADDTFVNHLLDTLRTMAPSERAGKGPLASFHLSPPLYALHWQTVAGQDAPAKTFEIRLGAPGPQGLGRYGYIPVDGQADESKVEVYLFQGAAFQMLEYLTAFDGLRRRVLSTFESDDVDEYRLLNGTREIFYAQRETNGWVDRKHRPTREDGGRILDELTHLRAFRFLDQDGDILTKITNRPDFTAVLKDRHDAPVTIKVLKFGIRLVAWVSTRQETLFELYPEAEKHFRVR